MKFQTIYLDNHTIEIHNTLYGKESIFVDGQLMSSQWSIFGALHEFEFEGDQYEFSFSWTISGIGLNLYKNQKPIIVSSSSKVLKIVLGILLILFLFDKFL